MRMTMELFDVYKTWDIEPVKGFGTRLIDKNGEVYTDLYGGHAVISIGHCHPHYVKMLTEQLGELGFYSNAVQNHLQRDLAHRLGKLSNYDDYKLFLCNSGAEANENAMKLASFHTGKAKILAFGHAFHGRTSGAVAATDNPDIRSPFNGTDNVKFVALNDLNAVEKELSGGEYAAVMIEGIQGVAGIQMPGDAFLRELRRLCYQYSVLLILDEIQSGCGRSGKYFAHQWSGIRADLVTMAKGIGNGFPIGAVMISPTIQARYGMLGTTFGGNHLACTAALAVCDVIENENLIANAAKVGDWLREAFKGNPALTEFRGRGLMIGLEVKPGYEKLRERLLFEKHFFTGASGAKVIRLLPALTLGLDTAKSFVKAWNELI